MGKIVSAERQQCITNIFISVLSTYELTVFPTPQGIRSHRERGVERSPHACVRGEPTHPNVLRTPVTLIMGLAWQEAAPARHHIHVHTYANLDWY